MPSSSQIPPDAEALEASTHPSGIRQRLSFISTLFRDLAVDVSGPNLIWRDPEDGTVRVFQLLADRTTIGRAPGNDIVLSIRSVSRRHAKICCTSHRIVLTDLDSANGTSVNGKMSATVDLRDGMQIEFGSFPMLFCNQPSQLGGDNQDSVSTQT
ncbi:FHA domain-containing protein [Actomonas aquatica]|uniref:FHA domain-containing protein n=1 Tax=Actomonas aquatica TaxID=2866162 RepID=A0ABZ1C2Z7_9BACT|nr:FHA domain-containing protein [Opitutus sp. WL0086]WRQ85730.1 FHA domain-containing protein [Opitutus sp. WL0086]